MTHRLVYRHVRELRRTHSDYDHFNVLSQVGTGTIPRSLFLSPVLIFTGGYAYIVVLCHGAPNFDGSVRALTAVIRMA